MKRRLIFNTELVEIELVEHSQISDEYAMEIEYRYSDGTAIVSLTRDDLRELGQSLIDFANERE